LERVLEPVFLRRLLTCRQIQISQQIDFPLILGGRSRLENTSNLFGEAHPL